jgi:hypothetical protein
MLEGGALGGLATVREAPLAQALEAGEPPVEEAPLEEPTNDEGASGGGGVGTTYYVSPSGSDSNPGTSSALPWRTLAKVNSAALKAGDTVLFEGGAVFSGQSLEGNAGGTARNPITYGSYGIGKADIEHGVWDASHNFLVYKNLEVAGAGVGLGVGFGGRGNHVTVENSTVSHVSEGIGVVWGDGWRIVGNTIEDTGDSGILTQMDDNGGRPGDAWVIDNNVIRNTGLVNLGYGEHGIYLKCRDSEVAGNVITNFAQDGISQRYGNARIVGNKIRGGAIGIAYFEYDEEALTSEWLENEIENTRTGMYAAEGTGLVSPNGPDLESFILSKNVIGPLTGGSTDFMNMNTSGTISEPGGNVLR